MLKLILLAFREFVLITMWACGNRKIDKKRESALCKSRKVIDTITDFATNLIDLRIVTGDKSRIQSHQSCISYTLSCQS